MPGIIPADEKLLRGVYFRFPYRGPGGASRGFTVMRFQFPPIIKSDSKGGNWHEFDMRMAEPYALFKGGQPREIQLKTTYIVTNEPTVNGGTWNIDNISTLIKHYRSYFYNQIGTALIIDFRAYDVVGNSASGGLNFNDGAGTDQGGSLDVPFTYTFRAENVSIEHSDAMISDGGMAYPLRTDVSLKLKFFTTLADPKEAAKEADASLKEHIVNVKGLKPIPQDWKWM